MGGSTLLVSFFVDQYHLIAGRTIPPLLLRRCDISIPPHRKQHAMNRQLFRPTSQHHAMVFCLVLSLAAWDLPLALGQQDTSFSVIAYYRGHGSDLNDYRIDRLTHVCFSFVHLKGDRLVVRNARDSVGIRALVSLKKQYPGLKIILSFGGWGACESCSEVFSSPERRGAFAQSAKDLLQFYSADGLDLDWEYPAIEGYPGHRYTPQDKHHFTMLVRELRNVVGQQYELSFAAGGFTDCLKNSIEWEQVMPLVDRVHVMSYDLVNGYSTVTGHHTPLFSSPEQGESTQNAVRFLDSIGVPRRKIVIGAAFYARVWKDVENRNNGLYQQGEFTRYVGYRDFETYFTPESGFECRWDSIAQAPYRYSAKHRLFATFDDVQSVSLKTRYAFDNRLGGIMFWELTGDIHEGGLLEAIDRTRRQWIHRYFNSRGEKE